MGIEERDKKRQEEAHFDELKRKRQEEAEERFRKTGELEVFHRNVSGREHLLEKPIQTLFYRVGTRDATREELIRAGIIDDPAEANSEEASEITRKARENLSDDQRRLAEELDEIIKDVRERLNRAANAGIYRLAANSDQLRKWLEFKSSVDNEVGLLTAYWKELRKLGVHVPSFREDYRKLMNDLTQAKHEEIADRVDWRRDDLRLGYQRIRSILAALGVVEDPRDPYANGADPIRDWARRGLAEHSSEG